MLINIFDNDYTIQVCTSIILFSLYTLTTLLDTNTAIKESGIIERPVSKFKLIYTYFAAFITYFIRVTILILSVFIIISIIRTSIIVIFNIIKPQKNNNEISAKEIEDNYKEDIFDKIQNGIRDNSIWTLGLYQVPLFIPTMLLIAPLLFILSNLGYILFIYNTKNINENTEEEKLKIMGTLNKLLFFMIVIIIIQIILQFTSLYMSNITKKTSTEN